MVLAILRRETTAAEAARAHGLDPELVEGWRRRFVQGGEDALRDERRSESLAADRSAWSGSRPLLVALTAVCLLWLALRVAYFNGYYTEDAPGYVTDAIELALGRYHARDYITGLNVGTYLPVALPLAIFGKSEVALALWPLFCSLLGLLSLVGASAMLFGRRAGLLAGLLYATYPGDVFFSTVVMPDAIQAGWLAFSVFLVVSAYAGSVSRRHWKLAAAGIGMGFCLLVRANGALLLPIGLFAVVVLARRWQRDSARGSGCAVLTYLAGWVSVLAVEGLVYLWAAGDFLHRFHVVNRHYGTLQSIGQWGLNTSWNTIPFSAFPPLLWWRIGGWGALNQDQAYHGLIFCFAVAGVVLGALALWFAKETGPGRSLAGLALGAFWLAWPLLYHQFGSQSITHFVPIHRLSRHLVVYAPGAVFVTVAGCALIARAVFQWRSAPARRTVAVAGLLILALHLTLNWESEQVAYSAFHQVKATYVRIREHLPPGVQTIVADPGDLCFLDFWLNPMGVERVRVRAFANYSRCDELPDGVVLTRSNPGWHELSAPVIQETVRRLPCLLQPPSGWWLLYDGYPEKIFVVGPARDAVR